MGILRRVGRSGDTPHEWSVDNQGQIQEAQRVFDEMIGKGGLAFGFDAPSSEGRQLDAFDPGAKEIVVFPRIAGG